MRGKAPDARKTGAALALAAVLGAAQLPWAALASQAAEVVQKGRAFAVRDIEIARGGVVRFLNEDEFPHQINVKGPGVSVDSGLQDPGQSLEVAFPSPGTFDVRCGVHPRMRMSVRVE